MRLAIWQPEMALFPLKQLIVRRVRWVKLFLFLRGQRQRILDTYMGVSDDVASQETAQDVAHDPAGQPRLRQGVTRDQRISVEDADIRLGRKSACLRVDDYKQHMARNLDSRLVRAVGLSAANAPAAGMMSMITPAVAQQGVQLREVHMNRASIASPVVRKCGGDLTIFCKAWSVGNGDRFAKTAFTPDWDKRRLHCSARVRVPLAPGTVVHFPALCCRSCQLQEQCTFRCYERHVHIYPDERLLAELRTLHATVTGLAALCDRIGIEHTIGQWQGGQGSYRCLRKNLIDLRRMAVVSSLHDLMRLPDVVCAA